MTSIIFIDTSTWSDSSIDRTSDFYLREWGSNPGTGGQNYFFVLFQSLLMFGRWCTKDGIFAYSMQNSIFCTPSTKNMWCWRSLTTISEVSSVSILRQHRSRRCTIRQRGGGGGVGQEPIQGSLILTCVILGYKVDFIRQQTLIPARNYKHVVK